MPNPITTSTTAPARPAGLLLAALALLLPGLLGLSACSDAGAETSRDEHLGDPTDWYATELPPAALEICREVFARTVSDADQEVVVVADRTASGADLPPPRDLLRDIEEASLAGGALTLVAVDGEGAVPRIVAKHVALSTPGERDRPSVRKIARRIASCVPAVYGTALLPTRPGTDLHRALSLAAELAGPGATLWLLSDGVATAGPLALDEDVVLEDAADVGRRAAAAAPVELAGTTLRAAGVGNLSTPLLSANRRWLRDYLRALCEGWGADGCELIEVDPVDPVRSAEGLPVDRTPAFPGVRATEVAGGCRFRLPGALAFAGDSAELDADVAQVLREPLRLLSAHPDATATVVGHTASSSAYTAAELLGLSRRRAEAVTRWLVGEGIDRKRLVSRGVGDTEPEVEDLGPDGRQLAGPAAHERRVDVQVEGVPCSR